MPRWIRTRPNQQTSTWDDIWPVCNSDTGFKVHNIFSNLPTNKSLLNAFTQYLKALWGIWIFLIILSYYHLFSILICVWYSSYLWFIFSYMLYFCTYIYPLVLYLFCFCVLVHNLKFKKERKTYKTAVTQEPDSVKEKATNLSELQVLSIWLWRDRFLLDVSFKSSGSCPWCWSS